MEERLLALLAEHHGGVVVTLKRDGRPQLSNVSYTFDPDRRLIRASITDGRAKTKNLRRDPRVSFYVAAPDFRAYVVAEGDAELTPVAGAPDDATVDDLVDVYREIAGEHPDWDEYRAAMVADQRLVLRIPVTRVYGMA
ncbi:PPOX class F420-dependent oxidoreductase [Actinophytocola oryzae]|uniref:PPOX class probable F420-dependent enzyme n=1 Tax=Actinophytocola oryzae TaxID=502181 RepID=A0A4R7V987_9PSEU|nr:PPOX class F420-dependent oxidoreductase [Actinophytocola oryzae]TDV45482.1 PPOX class probable F420-dependent enzyme [Actinophytocola oryzae]